MSSITPVRETPTSSSLSPQGTVLSGGPLPVALAAISSGSAAMAAAPNSSLKRLSFAKQLEAWVDEKKNTPEHQNRLEAQKRILNCYDSQSVNLDLSNLELTSLPDCFASLANLNLLNLNNNQLTFLPDSFASLSKLGWLYLKNNRLTFLPSHFGSLSKLSWLELSNNLLTSLPDSFGNLLKLSSLLLKNNRLTFLPDSFGSLVKLEWLYLKNNPLRAFPAFNPPRSLSHCTMDDVLWSQAPKSWLRLTPSTGRDAAATLEKSLLGAICLWMDIPQTQVESFRSLISHPESAQLASFLHKLMMTLGYRKKPVPYQKIVQPILKAACSNETFRKDLFDMVPLGNYFLRRQGRT